MIKLVQLATLGDEKASEQLVQLHKSKLTAAAFSYTKNYEEAQDIVQETFLKAFQSLHQLKEPKYFSTWLYKILIRQCFSVLNRQKRSVQALLELQQLQLLQQEASTNYDDLYEALSSLKSDYQTTLILHYFYDFKLQEIAAMNAKPLNTVKIQLHRARLQLKKQLESMQQLQIKQQDVNAMLKQLKQAALQFFTIPSSYELCIEEIQEDNTIFFWKEVETEEGYYIEFDKQGRLLSLSQPVTKTAEQKSNEELQQIAESFLTAQYPEALQYFTLTKVKKHKEHTRFNYEQLVYGIPLNRKYCFIDVAHNGQVVEFTFKGYTKNPPSEPAQLAPTEAILTQLTHSQWTARLSYFSNETYTVNQSGLHILYESPLLYASFDASTGEDLFEQDEEEIEEPEVFEALPDVPIAPPLETLEEIIGITPSMEIIRQAEIDEDAQGIVWREKEYKAPTDKSMDSFIEDRFEQTVKATIKPSTGQLKGFVWFKTRTGDLHLTMEECQHIAVAFIKTYYPDYVPYLKMKVKERSFNELHRAFFTFTIFVDGYCLEGETFMLSVNQTTGYVDMLMTPRIELEMIQAFTPASLLPLTEAKKALQQVEAILQWDTHYVGDESIERLTYTFARHKTKQRIKGIDAVTGMLISLKD